MNIRRIKPLKQKMRVSFIQLHILLKSKIIINYKAKKDEWKKESIFWVTTATKYKIEKLYITALVWRKKIRSIILAKNLTLLILIFILIDAL